MVKKVKWKRILICIFLIQAWALFAADNNVIRIYIDADRSGVKSSGIAIEQGIRLALSEVDYRIGSYTVDLRIRDHHGSSRRSTIHLKEYLEDPRGLAVFSGLHSPPILANLSLINEKGILLLDPWAAAGPITRKTGPDGKNWVFRLSVDDTKAGEVIVSHAVDFEKFRKPVLLLEDTGWGKSNKNSMTQALKKRGLEPVDIIWFDWNIGKIGAEEILSDIRIAGADVIFLVANAPEGKTFITSMAKRSKKERIPIRSHWGITGGNFFESLGPEILTDKVDLKFIQTRFSFMDKKLTSFQKDVLNKAVKLFPGINKAADIKAPCGLIHAYDLTRILITAVDSTRLTGDIVNDRALVRDSLENIKNPVQGLIKSYQMPFTVFSDKNPDAHEALGVKDFRMAYYTKNGTIKLIHAGK